MNNDGPIVSVTDATFATEVLGAELPVLVDFWAAWCGPCRMVEPVLARIAQERAGRLRIVSLDADTNPLTMRDCGVLSMPTLDLYVGGRVVTRIVGAKPKVALDRILDEYLPVGARL